MVDKRYLAERLVQFEEFLKTHDTDFPAPAHANCRQRIEKTIAQLSQEEGVEELASVLRRACH